MPLAMQELQVALDSFVTCYVVGAVAAVGVCMYDQHHQDWLQMNMQACKACLCHVLEGWCMQSLMI